MNSIGVLYIVATPIGNLGDFSARGIETLRSVALIAAEDTRHSRYLLDQFAINTPMRALHDFNEQQRASELVAELQQGKSIALISDAGTPLISDPGFRLVQIAREAGIKVVPIPGACALIAALSVAGLPSDRFVFEGFLPAKHTARLKQLQSLQKENRTLIFYEAPHRITALLDDLLQAFGESRQAVLARELTKLYETVKGGALIELRDWLHADPNQQKGEFVVLVQGAEISDDETIKINARQILQTLLSELPVNQAVKLASKISGEKKNLLYAWALEDKAN